MFLLKCLLIEELDNLLYRTYCSVQRKTNSITLFLKSAKQNEQNQQQQNNVGQFFVIVVVVENSGVIFLEETQPRKRNRLCTE